MKCPKVGLEFDFKLSNAFYLQGVQYIMFSV